MAYDESLADRVRASLVRRHGVSEKKMFGGICFLVYGNMCCGVNGTELFSRLGRDGVARALKEPYTRPCDFTGSIIKTIVIVSTEAFRSDDVLKDWVDQSVISARSLPRKQA